MDKQTYYIIDGNAYMYRAFFAIPHFTRKDGFPTNAIFGFAKMLLTLRKDNPTSHIIVAFDHKGKTFRSDLYKEYKAHREKMPDELAMQIPAIKKLPELFHMPILEIEGMEADDSIASFVTQRSEEEDCACYIITGDKDMMQLVHGDIYIMDTMKNVVYDRTGVKQKMGVYPEQIIDLLGIMGDKSDNIPGVPGIGPKGAVKLLEEYPSMEAIYEHIEEITGSTQKKLKEHKKLALLSKELATIKTDIDLSHVTLIEDTPDISRILDFLQEYECFSLRRDAEALFGEKNNIITTTNEEEEQEIASKDFEVQSGDSIALYKHTSKEGEEYFVVSNGTKRTHISPEDFPSFLTKLESLDDLEIITDYAKNLWYSSNLKTTATLSKEHSSSQPSLF